jgi:hypothetical protein
MKVYVVMRCPCDYEKRIVGVYQSRADAEKACGPKGEFHPYKSKEGIIYHFIIQEHNFFESAE